MEHLQHILVEVAGGESPLDVVVLRETIANLEPNLRETVLLKLEGLSNRQIGDRLNVTERQIQRRLKYLWQLLLRQLDGREDA